VLNDAFDQGLCRRNLELYDGRLMGRFVVILLTAERNSKTIIRLKYPIEPFLQTKRLFLFDEMKLIVHSSKINKLRV
jgi:hypothetical protein